ncbi:SGNH/GDSL hydrolase family protein [Roseateles violae]|uniref:SGNH/GDSL hydrolase family protein n=1 Tax=Roseateles violae TaxID=3058042 RepID=A0ABT8DVH8_9BURK|nr:SGNH/GDSL hydrolase family protein [Pelomonas sp. PFR6]MDN3922299.1 SGNH/GDSL hydrolase family protein [Pelomonas sp. PFR6]
MLTQAAKLALAPLLLWQGAQVRRRALRLPEAAGARSGLAGSGELRLRLLIVGDSSGAGVGAATQEEALAGRLSRALADRLGGAVHWQLRATTGHLSRDALAELRLAELQPADVLVTALGVNDVVGQVSPRRWLATLSEIDALARQRAGVRYTLHSAVPPMHAFPLLPQPLRWLMGAQALRMNRALGRALFGDAGRGLQALPPDLHGAAAARLMAEDGFHPGPAGYALWAETLAERIAKEMQRQRLKSH